MSGEDFHVVIIGGGLGGLCLAQGLKQAGIRFSVYERDRSATSRPQGYRIHIDPQGSRALHQVLPERLWRIFTATGGQFSQGFTVMTEGMQELLSLRAADAGKMDPVAQHRSISRVHLRRVLLAGLEDAVHFDRRFLRYEESSEGKLTVFFEDGSRVEADVLVAADGIHSRVRRQYLPGADPVETGVVGIGGRIPLEDGLLQRLPQQALEGPIMVLPPTACSLFLALWKPVAEARQHLELLGGELPLDEEPYLIFSLGGRAEFFGFAPGELPTDAELLRGAMREAMRGWHPELRALADRIDPAEFGVFPVRTSRPIPAWKSSPVTLLGDAIHSMTPYRGIGGNIALKDGALLAAQLAEARAGRCTLLEAVAGYEAQMRRYAFAAVADSRKAMEGANGRKHPVLFPMARVAMRTANAVLHWRRRKAG